MSTESAGIEVIAGLMILTGLFLPLALVLIFPTNVNILLFHVLLAGGSGIELGLILTLLNVILMVLHLPAYQPMFRLSGDMAKTR